MVTTPHLSRERIGAVVALTFTLGCGGNTEIAETDSSPAQGYISLDQATSTATGEYWSASARFYRLASVSGPSCAILASENNCNLVECPPIAPLDRTSVDVGQIEIDGEQRIELNRGADGTYASTAQGALWSAGEAINVRVQGKSGGLSSFVATLTGPGSVTFTQPSDASTIDRSQDLQFAWTSETKGYLLVTTSRTGAPDEYLSCRWAAGDQSRVIPTSLLTRMSPGPISFEAEVESPPSGQLVGDWAVSASALWSAQTIAATLE